MTNYYTLNVHPTYSSIVKGPVPSEENGFQPRLAIWKSFCCSEEETDYIIGLVGAFSKITGKAECEYKDGNHLTINFESSVPFIEQFDKEYLFYMKSRKINKRRTKEDGCVTYYLQTQQTDC